ncbi:MAG: phosphodiester glycosidase family protein [Nitriliruptor sp.]
MRRIAPHVPAAPVAEVAVAAPPAAARRSRSAALAALIAVLAVLVPAAPADALEVRTGNTERVLGGLSSQTLDITLDDGARVRGHALRFRDESAMELRPRLAQDKVSGYESMSSMVSREHRRGAIAGVNGGYAISRPSGAPNGLFVSDDRLVTTNALGSPSGVTQRRAAAGIRPDGRIVGDELNVALTLDSADLGLTGVPVDDLNRLPLESETDRILIFDANFGQLVPIPAGSVLLRAEDLPLGSSGRTETRVVSAHDIDADGAFTARPGETLIVATGERAATLADATSGTRIGVTVTIAPFTGGTAADWADLRGAVNGAGLLVKDGVAQPGWSFSDQGVNHAGSRRARTAMGSLTDGRSLLVTIQESSVTAGDGVTLEQLGRIMRDLGAVDAVAIDGGGSSTMYVGDEVRMPQSDPKRVHSSAVFVYAPLPPPSRSITGACPPGSVPDGGFEDTADNVHAGSIDCLKWWQVTEGIAEGVYAPGGDVSRQQMASFLARWIDDLAARGDGRALPTDAPNRFDDVQDGSTHEPAISRLAQAGVISGTTATTYSPGLPVRRGQTASLVARAVAYASGAELPPAADTFMDDNTSNHEPSIDRLAHAGVIGGTGGYRFAPDRPVSRAAMASLVMRASDLLVEQGVVAPPA